MTPPKLTIVGHCTSNSARIFCCCDHDAGGTHPVARLAWLAADSRGFIDILLTKVSPYNMGVFHLTNLPDCAEVKYTIDVANDRMSLSDAESLIGSSNKRSFHLLPQHRPLRVALVSCNGAYEMPNTEKRYILWQRLSEQIKAGNVDIIIHAGDQIYTDPLVAKYQTKFDKAGSISHNDSEELTEEYRRLYVEQSWSIPEVANVLASCPSIMMWDDHDIYDGWGSNDNDDQPSHRIFFHAARQTFNEFQASLNPDGIDENSFACGFYHGDVAFLLLDGRTHRMYKNSMILGLEQREVARKWLAAVPQTCRRLYLVLGIPPVHAKVTTFLAIQKWLPIKRNYESDMRDTWVSPQNMGECAALMAVISEFLKTHSTTDLTILAGDIHVGSIGLLECRDNGNDSETKSIVWQITSSGIGSPPPTGFTAWLLKWITRSPLLLGAGVEGRLLPIMPNRKDILLRRNFAILQLDDGAKWKTGSTMDVSFFAEGIDEALHFTLPSRKEKYQIEKLIPKG